MSEQQSIHGVWTKRWTFVLAATGSAVGLGNIWKFPYMAGENGGGAFVLIYLVFIFSIGIPVMLAEILLGRRGRASPINSMHKLADEAGATPFWGGIGWLGALAGMLILSFYSVVAGWAVSYVYLMASDSFSGQSADAVGAVFGDLLGDPWRLLGWHSVFMVMTIVVVANGIHRGLEMAVQWLMPLLFIMLLVLLGYSATQDAFGASLDFMFKVDFSKLTQEAILSALGHSFFTLSLGMGAIMAYGAYMSRQQNLATTVVTIGLLDTLVAIVAGIVIFTIVFNNGLEPGAGPSLMFKTLPIAFSKMPAGVYLGTMFFVLVVAAAWSSAISLAEPAVAWAVESTGVGRVKAAIFVGLIAWTLGIGCALSLNIWSDFTIFGNSLFDFFDKLTTNIMLPLGGLTLCLFVGWVMDRAVVRNEVDISHPTIYRVWYLFVRVLSPVGVAVVMINKLFE
ncbi:sodium-dependent transporter [Ketobacter sp. MCCC 1A13808]|uniref:sodium-dependent transporter n=1 Tax=Ketobacter sp. MCCC 1A13808 TaxID=2602738 RepID=UPI000F1DAAB6|nr:sodium-dependent transporter [Ketobacter sp. MCCC 1A13808]MVF13017.1 sodium-dependent transporter [Ketobacter sp. MCCC 1A13808]RLP53860.1 MAG: sodium-dependent transporter [Ketobacter sp.]